MPIYLYACECGNEIEQFFKMADRKGSVPCPCGKSAIQKPAIGCVQGDEAAWLRATTEVVDKEGGEHCQRFIKYPTRSNYHAWMQGEGLRPMEPGEEKRKTIDKRAERKRRVEHVMRKRKERNRITVNS